MSSNSQKHWIPGSSQKLLFFSQNPLSQAATNSEAWRVLPKWGRSCIIFKSDFSQLSDHNRASNLSGYLANLEEPSLKSPPVFQASKAVARALLGVALGIPQGPALVLPEL